MVHPRYVCIYTEIEGQDKKRPMNGCNTCIVHTWLASCALFAAISEASCAAFAKSANDAPHMMLHFSTFFYSILFVGGTCRYTLNLLSFAESLYCIVLYCIELAIRSSTVVSTKLPWGCVASSLLIIAEYWAKSKGLFPWYRLISNVKMQAIPLETVTVRLNICGNVSILRKAF